MLSMPRTLTTASGRSVREVTLVARETRRLVGVRYVGEKSDAGPGRAGRFASYRALKVFPV